MSRVRRMTRYHGLLLVALLNWRHDSAVGRELRDSLQIEHGDMPSGEQALWTMIDKRRRRGG